MMKIYLLALLAILMASAADDEMRDRGVVMEAVDNSTSVMDSLNFSGFYYDLDDGLGTERISITVKEGCLCDPDGVIYDSIRQEKAFDFEDWGMYYVIGFLGEGYFAGYSGGTGDDAPGCLYDESPNPEPLADEMLLKVLIDDDSEHQLSSGSPLDLEDGYQLHLRSVDVNGEKVSLELRKDGGTLDSKVISPSSSGSDTGSATYIYKRFVGGEEIVIVAVHFKSAFLGDEKDPKSGIASIDGVFQLSDMPKDVEEQAQFDKMRVVSVDATGILMRNEDDNITLSRNDEIKLMDRYYIRTSDQEMVDSENPLRFYIYRA
ncbi:MAG: hypothetical protein JW986_07165 [Methanotrichaceae archaeon]|nr:hypothetical protein [Methanotrichaceae archaeon]